MAEERPLKLEDLEKALDHFHSNTLGYLRQAIDMLEKKSIDYEAFAEYLDSAQREVVGVVLLQQAIEQQRPGDLGQPPQET